MAGLLDGLLNGNSSGDGSGLLSFLNSLGMGPGMPPADPSASFSDRFGAATPPAFGAPPASIIGANSPTGTMPDMTAPAATQPASFADRFGAAPAAPFGVGVSPMLFASAPGSTPGNPALPSAPVAPPIVAQDDSEDDAPAAPIGVGGYQMPRIGSADAFTPDPAALPANSQPTQGQGSPIQAAPAAAPATPGIGQRIGAALSSLGAPDSLFHNMVTNPVNALITGQTQDDIEKSKTAKIANQTARALIAKGVDPQIAIAAVQPGNGDALKELFKTAIGGGSHTQETDKDGNVWDVNKQTGQRTISLAAKDDKFQHFVVKNPDGSEAVKSFNTKTGEVTDVPRSGPGAVDRPAVDPDSTGADRMKQLQASDPNYARRVQAAVDGDIQLPTQGQAARSPAAARFTEDVLAVSGSTSASDFATKAATRKDYASGIASRVTKSINTTIGHFATLDDTIDKLGNHTYFPSITNYVHDKYASNTDPEYQKAKATFETNKEAAIKELDFALSGGHSSVSGSAEIRDKFNRADSPETLHAAVTEAMSLLQKRLQSHAKAFSEGTKSQRDEQDFIYPENRQSFNKLLGSKDTSTGSDVPGVGAVASPLKPGESSTINGVTIKRVN